MHFNKFSGNGAGLESTLWKPIMYGILTKKQDCSSSPINSDNFSLLNFWN